MRSRTAQHPRMRWENRSRLSNSATARSHFRCRFRGSSPPWSFCLCLTNMLASHLCCSPRVSFLRTISFPLSFSHFVSTLYISLSLSILLPSYPSCLRGQSYGESDRAVVESVEGAGWMKVVGGRRREGKLCVELIRAWLTGSRL